MKRPKKDAPVEVWTNGEMARYKGLHWCSSIWTCPICAKRISEERRKKLRYAVEKSGYSKVLVTVTLAHDRNDHLVDLIDELNKALQRLKSGRWWQEFSRRWSLVAHVSSLEITDGGIDNNGWHPHKHWLLFLDLPEGKIDTRRLKEELTVKYKALLAKSGRYASDIYGIDVKFGDQAVGDYLEKWSLEDEIAKAVVKNGREGSLSPWQLLDKYIEGDKQAGARFIEYALATKGRSQLVWSRGGSEKLGFADLTDEEINASLEETEEDQGPEYKLLLSIDEVAWSAIVKKNMQNELLENADAGDQAQVVAFLERLGIRQGVFVFGAPIGVMA